MSRTLAILVLVFFVLAVVAAALGFSGILGEASKFAQIAFAVAMGLAVIVAFLGMATNRRPRAAA